MKHRKLHLSILVALALWGLVYNFFSSRLHAATLDCATALNITVSVEECTGLVDLFNSTAGEGRTTATNWVTDTDVCTWYGVSCDYVNSVIHVTALSLVNNNLIGTLPDSMSGLIYLRDLNLRNNEISSILPAAWSAMVSIQSINLSNNLLTGTLPSSRSVWSELSGMNLSDNTLQGELPIVWKNLTGLRSFSIAHNQFSGTLKTERSLRTQIHDFNVSGNTFNGTLPDSWAARSWLTSFIVTNNNFVGDIPASRANLSDLNELELDYNCFNIDLPEPPASFVDDVAGSDWETKQTHCLGDLTIEKSVDLTQAFPGSQLVYTITYINNSIASTPWVVVSDTLPLNVTYLSSPTTSGLVVTGSAISWQIGTVAPQSVNIVKIIAQVNANVASGTIINNNASVTGLLFDTDMNNNLSNTVQTLIFTVLPPTFGWGGGGGGNPPVLPPVLPVSSGFTSSNPPAAPPVKSQCPYDNGQFSLYKNTFMDIPWGIYKQAIDLLLDHCLIEGFYNEGKIFGTYSFVKWWEAYKIYYRLTGLPIIPPPSDDIHWAETYRKGGDKIKLRASISAGTHPVNSNISYADVYTIANNLLRYFGKPPLQYISGINYGDSLTRGAFALFLQNIIEKISE